MDKRKGGKDRIFFCAKEQLTASRLRSSMIVFALVRYDGVPSESGTYFWSEEFL